MLWLVPVVVLEDTEGVRIHTRHFHNRSRGERDAALFQRSEAEVEGAAEAEEVDSSEDAADKDDDCCENRTAVDAGFWESEKAVDSVFTESLPLAKGLREIFGIFS